MSQKSHQLLVAFSFSKLMYLLNAILFFVYLAASLCQWIQGGILNHSEYYAGYWRATSHIWHLSFILYCLLAIYRIHSRGSDARWWIGVDSLMAILWVLGVPFFAFVLIDFHPAALLYGSLLSGFKLIEFSSGFVWLCSLKLFFNLFNLIYFFAPSLLKHMNQQPIAHLFWVLPALIMSHYPNMMKRIANQETGHFYSETLNKHAQEILNTIECEEVRNFVGRVVEKEINQLTLSIDYQYDWTTILIIDSSGRTGQAKKEMYDCGPQYSPEAVRTNEP